MKQTLREPQFAICLQNEEAEDPVPRKVYQLLEDASAARDGYLRVVDESNEDYLYPAAYFIRLELPKAAVSALALRA
jgi:hypothetical protein